MFYYIEVHLLAHYIQWIKMHGETVKFISEYPLLGAELLLADRHDEADSRFSQFFQTPLEQSNAYKYF
jgi:hypothetical protein